MSLLSSPWWKCTSDGANTIAESKSTRGEQNVSLPTGAVRHDFSNWPQYSSNHGSPFWPLITNDVLLGGAEKLGGFRNFLSKDRAKCSSTDVWRTEKRRKFYLPRLWTICARPDHHWCCFKDSFGQSSDSRDGVCAGLSKPFDGDKDGPIATTQLRIVAIVKTTTTTTMMLMVVAIMMMMMMIMMMMMVVVVVAMMMMMPMLQSSRRPSRCSTRMETAPSPPKSWAQSWDPWGRTLQKLSCRTWSTRWMLMVSFFFFFSVMMMILPLLLLWMMITIIIMTTNLWTLRV